MSKNDTKDQNFSTETAAVSYSDVDSDTSEDSAIGGGFSTVNRPKVEGDGDSVQKSVSSDLRAGHGIGQIIWSYD